MKKWENALYQNDIAFDVRDRFETMYHEGKNVQDITAELTSEYECIMGDINEEPLFWMALADTQWNMGVLLHDVKERTLYWIGKNNETLEFQATNMPDEESKISVLSELSTKLLSPQPSVKKLVKRRLYKCQWQVGDVYAYQLDSDLAKKRGFYGRYFLIQKVDEYTWYPGHIVPIVYVKITRDSTLPRSMDEYNQLEYVQTWFQKNEERLWPIDMNRLKEDIAEKSRMEYKTDEYGFLPEYRAILLNTSKKVIPNKLIYVGNFENATPPRNEFVPHTKDNIIDVAWKRFDETFESKMIKQYCYHNLRELSIYKDKEGFH